MSTSMSLERRSVRTRCWSMLLLLALQGVTAVGIAADAPARAAIASAHPLATAAGHEILRDGGNAFDAAVAVAAALAVVEPYSSGLGGGGFWLLHRAADAHQVMIDARETAPAATSLTQYLDAAGRPIPGATRQGGTAAGIPGVPAGLALLAQKYGRLPLSRTLSPAITLATHGFAVDPRYARIAQLRERFLRDGAGTAVFLDDGRAPAPGFVLRQPHLARTLTRLAQQGRDGFYRGAVADALVRAANAAGGVWALEDLERYATVERAPVRFTYRGATIVSAALPSAGGVTLAQAFNILEQFPPADAREPAGAHLVVEALRRGFQDRALWLGDIDFVQAPLARLTSKAYGRARAAGIDPLRATPGEQLGTAPARVESGNTTHYSIVDQAGNRVGATLSINFLFGAGIVAGDTGVLLNNEMDDFSLKPELPNAYRLRGGEANVLAPRKRPLSSMTPTFVEDAKGVLVLGAPGGSRIISMVLLGVLDYLAQPQVDLQRLVAAPRYHHQHWPDYVEVEPGAFTPEWRAALEAKGHKLQDANRRWGNMQAVFRAAHSGEAIAASDPRGSDIAWY